MSRIKTGGRGFEFSRRELEIACADTMAEIDDDVQRRRDKEKSEKRESEVHDA